MRSASLSPPVFSAVATCPAAVGVAGPRPPPLGAAAAGGLLARQPPLRRSARGVLVLGDAWSRGAAGVPSGFPLLVVAGSGLGGNGAIPLSWLRRGPASGAAFAGGPEEPSRYSCGGGGRFRRAFWSLRVLAPRSASPATRPRAAILLPLQLARRSELHRGLPRLGRRSARGAPFLRRRGATPRTSSGGVVAASPPGARGRYRLLAREQAH
mmetsp:Transcript_99828/g.281844  ORF Transcript_99828/g.281844 Transcript_99828/m.281844 type:complete len:211 (-) Transcript_99828:45-677(-)